jgi:hypothetical protein
MNYSDVTKLGASLTSVAISHRYWTANFNVASEDPGPAIERAHAWFAELVDGLTGTEVLNVKAPKEPREKQPVVAEAQTEHGEVAHVAIKKFTLMETPKGWELLLYPDIKGAPGKYPELKVVGTNERVFGYLKPVWDNDWKPPLEKEVDWIAEYQLGKEYVPTKGPNAGKTMHYKDLVAIREAT